MTLASGLIRLPAAELPVAILANQDDPESLKLARYYAAQRGLPESDILALRLPLTEQITWEEFVVALWNPLVREAVKRGWLFASPKGQVDAVGRERIVSSGHRLRALVICRGVPLRIAHDPLRYDAKTNPLTSNAALATTEASVDSELAVLAFDDPPIAALLPNALFKNDQPSSHDLERILSVGRLDGPTLADAKNLVDSALIAERNGLAGRAYVDRWNAGGSYQEGDDWMEGCIKPLQENGFETDVDRSPQTFTDGVRFDAPVLYFGWYTNDLNGPFTEPTFRFPAGAVALHIHSFSAVTLRSATRGWTGPLIAKGVTATVGNVGEPYLQFTHQPDLLLRALLRGEPLGRAALYAIKGLSWKGIVIGDPLYRPFAVSAEAQWANRKTLPPATEQYARIRQMRLLVASGKPDDAIALGAAGLAQNPGLPLALTVASLRRAAGDNAGAIDCLKPFVTSKSFRRARPTDFPLLLAATQELHASGDSASALAGAKRLLDDRGLPRALRLAALVAGAEFARATNDMTLASRWATEHATLTAPPPPPATPTPPSAGTPAKP